MHKEAAVVSTCHVFCQTNFFRYSILDLYAGAYKSKMEYQELLAEHVAQLSAQQQLLYASNRMPSC